MYKNYDPTDKNSILKYAQKMKRLTFRDIIQKNLEQTELLIHESSENIYIDALTDNVSHKGNLGELIEVNHFHYKVDSEARADFPEAEVELKVTPYRKNKNGSISAKERLVISMINYFDITESTFYESNAWEKIKNILLVYYLWDENIKDRLDYVINFIYMYSPNEEDLQIIKNDFEKIQRKVINGEAHNLSEGDTLYLGAVTKSSNSRTRTGQPFSTIDAKPRAFSLKSSYMTHLLRHHIKPFSDYNDKILKQGKVENFESFVIEKINEFKNQRDTDLFNLFLPDKTQQAKHDYSRLAYEILGVKSKNAQEFEKANIKVKTIRVEENGKIDEHMSFPVFEIMELIEETWEKSTLRTMLEETKFLFVVYRKKQNNYYLMGAKFWNMLPSEIETTAKKEWKLIQNTFIDGVNLIPVKQKNRTIITNNLPGSAETNIIHVRPHASLSAYLIDGVPYGSGRLSTNSDLLPGGNRMTKQCFWINKSYILKQIEDLLK